jgi:hypothetical protein
MARCRHSSQLFTDASGTLCYGGIFGTKWFQGTWEPSHQIDKPGISIAWQELFAIVIACQLWGSILCNKRLICNCNESVVKMINSKCSKVPCVMYLLCYLTLLTLKFNLYIHSKHIPGKHNEIADSISRFQLQRFKKLAPQADPSPYPIPSQLLKI